MSAHLHLLYHQVCFGHPVRTRQFMLTCAVHRPCNTPVTSVLLENALSVCRCMSRDVELVGQRAPTAASMYRLGTAAAEHPQ